MMNRRQTRERITYFTPDGVEFILHTPPRRNVLSVEGTGMSPLEYITSRGALQHGETIHDVFLRPRIIQMLIRHNHCDRLNYWDGRANLLNYIRPNRASASNLGKLRYFMLDGTNRDIDVTILEGPKFEPSVIGRWDELAFQEVLRWLAPNPTWYDPSEQTTTFLGTQQLIFPITFPIVFGWFGQANLVYSGTWLEYPIIEIIGPITNPGIVNQTTDQLLALNYDVAAGESVTFDLRYGVKTVTNNSGVNLIGYLTTNSDMSFHLAPADEAPGGVNVIVVSGQGSTSNATIIIRWFRRFIGI